MKGKLKLKSVVALLLAMVLTFMGIEPMAGIIGSMREVQAEELTEITWSDFTAFSALTEGQTFSGETEATYNGGTLNNTAFEGDVVIPSGSGFRYAVPSTWFGFTIQENAGNLQIGGDAHTSLNGVKGVAYTLKANDYGLTSFTDTRFTIRIELYNLSDDNLNATLNIYVNGKEVGTSIPLIGSTATATTYLGNKIGFANNGLAGGITIYDVKPEFKKITWSDFTAFSALTDGQTFSGETEATYSGGTLNNTAFEGDAIIPAGSGFRYAVPSTWYGLTIQENAGNLQIGGDSYTSLNGVKGVAYTLKANDYGLTSFTDTRFTIRIELYNLSNDNLNATLNIYVNGIAVGYAIPLIGSTAAATTYLGNKIGFANNGLASGITIYNAMPELTEITWSDFTAFSALTEGQTFSGETEASYSGGTLNNTAFEGDVVIPSGSGFRYAVPSTWYGLTIQENAGNLQIGGDSYTSLNGVKGVAYTLKANDYGLTSFTDTRFTIRIELYNLSNDNLNATLNIYVNEKEVGRSIPLIGSTAAATTYLGNKIGFANNGLSGGITIYNTLSELTEITWSDFALTEGQTFETEREVAYNGGTLNNTAFEGDVVIPSGSGFRYAVPSTWYGLTIQENAGNLQIGGDSYTSLNGVKGVAYTLKANDYGLTSFTDTRFTIRIELYNLSDDNLNATLNIYVNGIVVGYAIPLIGSTAAATTYLGNKIGFANNGLNGGITVYSEKLTIKEITWETFGATYGNTYTVGTNAWDTSFTASGLTDLNNTKFKGDVIFADNTTIMYGGINFVSGLQFGVQGGNFVITSHAGFTVNPEVTISSANAADYGLTSFVEERFTLEIQMTELTTTQAVVNVLINDVAVASEIQLTSNNPSEASWQLGKILYVTAGSITTLKVKPAMTEIGWETFGATYGNTYTVGTNAWDTSFTASGLTDLNNTKFKGDVIFADNTTIMYGGINFVSGLQFGVQGGNFVITSHAGFTVNPTVTIPSANAVDYGLTSFVDTRFTLEIQMTELTTTQAIVNVLINNVAVSSEIQLTSNNPSEASWQLGKILYVTAGSITPLKNVAVPTDLTPLSWEEFGYTGGVTYTDTVGRKALHLENLDDTLFSGDVEMAAGSMFYYGGNGWQGIQIKVNNDGTISINAAGSSPGYSATFNPKHYGLKSFAEEKFNLKIAMTGREVANAGTGAYSEVIRIWVNDQILGDAFTYTEWNANVLGLEIVMNTEAPSAITPYSSRTTAPTGLTEISFTDWEADLEVDGKMLNGEISGAHPTVNSFNGTTLNEIVKLSGTETSTTTHIICYGGNGTNSWLGTRIQLSGKNMVISCLDNGISFTIDPQKAGVGSSFANTEFSWRIDTVKLENNVLLYMSFNGVLYNSAPFVLYDFADTISNTIEYNSYDGGTADQCANYYVVLGAATKTLPVLYHDLAKDDHTYTIPAYKEVTFYKQDANGEWIEATTPTTITETGNYKLEFNDGVSDYVQEIACYYYQTDVSAASLVRSLKMKQNGMTRYEEYEEGYETRLCDTNYDGKVDTNDINDIRDMLLGTYQAEENVMKISGFFSPTASLIEDVTYETIKETGVNHIIESDMWYSDDALDRYRVYAELSYAQKYGLTVTVRDQRLYTMGANGETATVETVQNAVANYKDYQSFTGLFIYDEPKASDYPNVGIWKGHNEVGTYSSVAKAIAAAGYEGWSNAFGGDADLFYNGRNSEAGCYMLYGYYNYLQNMVDSYDLDFMSFTCYPLTVDGNGVKDNDEIPLFFKNLALAKKVAENNNIPLRTFVQSTASNENNVNSQFSEAHMKWMANIGLAFGSKSLEYFTLVQAEELKTYTDGSCANGMVDKDGNKTKFAEWSKNANTQVMAVDDILLNATNKGFMSTGGVATSSAVENIMSISMKKSLFTSEKFTNDIHTSYEGATVSSNNTEYGAFTGCFEITDGEYSGKHAMYIVNFSDKGDNTVTVTLGDGVKSTTIYQGMEAEHTGTFNMTLAPGEAVLVVY